MTLQRVYLRNLPENYGDSAPVNFIAYVRPGEARPDGVESAYGIHDLGAGFRNRLTGEAGRYMLNLENSSFLSDDFGRLESILFEWLAREIGPENLPPVCPSLESVAAHSDIESDEFNAALAAVQDALGQDDGGLAGVFWHSGDGDEWPEMTPAERLEFLAEYVQAEIETLTPESYQ